MALDLPILAGGDTPAGVLQATGIESKGCEPILKEGSGVAAMRVIRRGYSTCPIPPPPPRAAAPAAAAKKK